MNNRNGSHIMMPLLRRTRLLPGESLPSLLERLVLCNYYPNVRIIAQICTQQRNSSESRDNLACPNSVETFVQIAHLAGIAPEALFDASPHRFAQLLTSCQQTPVHIEWIEGSSKITISPTAAKKYLHPASVTHYCPLCLKTSAYHHLNWVPVAIAVCLEHLCLLMNACPLCGKNLTVQEVVKRRCGACWANLCEAPVVPVTEDTLGVCAQHFFHCWLWERSPAPDWLARCGFPTAMPVTLYHLLENLLQMILSCYREWSILPAPYNNLAEHIPSPTRHLHRLSPKQIYSLYQVAFTGLMNWPLGLFQVLDACSGYFIPNLAASSRLQRLEPIRKEWSQPVWQEREYDFLQLAFANYLLKRNLSGVF